MSVPTVSEVFLVFVGTAVLDVCLARETADLVAAGFGHVVRYEVTRGPQEIGPYLDAVQRDRRRQEAADGLSGPVLDEPDPTLSQIAATFL